LQIYLSESGDPLHGLSKGWNIRYSTELSKDVWFYLRGEEYSAQIDHFLKCVEEGCGENTSPFASAVRTDDVLAMMRRELDVGPHRGHASEPASGAAERPLRRIFSRG